MIDRLSYKKYEIKVSEIALGEAIKVVCSNDNRTGLKINYIPELVHDKGLIVI